jgi:hypothetical protein
LGRRRRRLSTTETVNIRPLGSVGAEVLGVKSEDLLSDSFLAAACTEALVDAGALVAKEVRALAGRTNRPPVKERWFRSPRESSRL